MNNISLILLSIFLFSCVNFKENKEHRLILNLNDVKKISFQCGSEIIPLSINDEALLIEKINSAKHIGQVKGIVKNNLTIYLNNNDTINVRLLGNKFKWNKSKDWAYELNLDERYFDKLCLIKAEKEHIKTSIQIEGDYNQKNKFENDTSELIVIDSLSLAYIIIYEPELATLNLKFYKKEVDNWVFDYSIDSISSSYPTKKIDFIDFNFDGIEDAKLFIGTGARGANANYEIFIRDKNSKKFNHVKNSYVAPNLSPNSKTKKVEGTRFYGKTRFEEYIIIGDSLIIEKGIEVWSTRDWTYRYYEFYNQKGNITNSYLDSVKDYGESSYSPE